VTSSTQSLLSSTVLLTFCSLSSFRCSLTFRLFSLLSDALSRFLLFSLSFLLFSLLSSVLFISAEVLSPDLLFSLLFPLFSLLSQGSLSLPAVLSLFKLLSLFFQGYLSLPAVLFSLPWFFLLFIVPLLPNFHLSHILSVLPNYFSLFSLTFLSSLWCLHIRLTWMWMRSSRVVPVERLTINATVATVLNSIPASSDIEESDARQMKQC
jgi:hypothetical protein